MRYLVALLALPFYVFVGIFVILSEAIIAGIKTQIKVINLWYNTYIKKIKKEN
jgi:hypothetical protein